VEAAIEVDELVLGGCLRGEARIRERAEILEGAVFEGSLVTPRLAVAEGAVLSGPCASGPDALSRTPKAPTESPAEDDEGAPTTPVSS